MKVLYCMFLQYKYYYVHCTLRYCKLFIVYRIIL